jgi:hypothetical protein
MKKVFFILLMLSSQLFSFAQKVSDKDLNSYLQVYFKDETHSLYLALSNDGYSFTDVNGGKPIVAGDTIAEQKGIRDPYIMRGDDGYFYMAMTDLHLSGRQKGYRTTQWERPAEQFGWGNNRDLVLMKSKDLVNWTHTILDIDKSYPKLKVGCAWAPELIYDDKAKKIMIYFTMRLGNGGTKLYYSYLNKDFTKLETSPKILFEYPDTTKQILDADITKLPDGRFCMVYCAQEKPGGIKMALSDKINSGYKYQPDQVDCEPGACEAPNVFKRAGENKWVLLYDIFSIKPNNWGFAETTDFKTFTNLGHFNDGVMKATNFVSPKHGAIIRITKKEADGLKNYWDRKNMPLGRSRVRIDVPLDSIQLSDPAIIADKKTNMYYMTGTGGMLWKSKDVKLWSGPYNIAQPDTTSWMGKRPQIWAAEIHEYKGKYYYFATFTNRNIKIDTIKGSALDRRACHILVSDNAEGPYVSFGDKTYVPANMSTLDATFWVEDGKPYLLYCNEWLQNYNGTVERVQLKPDLSGSVGNRNILFFANESPWSKEKMGDLIIPNKVTDGPNVFRTQTGKLGMIWTSWVYKDYTMGVAYSSNGKLDGKWIQEKEPFTPPNFGHGMFFRTLEGKLLLVIHSHKDVNGRYIRNPHLFEIDDSGDKIILGKEYR